jgi:hypothetical protein
MAVRIEKTISKGVYVGFRGRLQEHLGPHISASRSWDRPFCASGFGRSSRRYLLVFRLGGPLYGLPCVFRHGDYRVYPQLVDLAMPGERGRDQARAKIGDITEGEIREHVATRL